MLKEKRSTIDPRYLTLLSKQFPTVAAVSTEIINLRAILELPKPTEHFMSDLHGEHLAFNHILNNASGVIRDKIDAMYSDSIDEEERKELATLIYYPTLKLELLKEKNKDKLHYWYAVTILRLVEICRVMSSKYTRSKVRKALPADFAYIIDELLHADYDEKNKEKYYSSIVKTIIDIGRGDAFICAISRLIKRLSVDRLHILGDIYDRGPGADQILESLMDHHAVDIQWGNHDILWMGAAAGSDPCIATVVNNSLQYANIDTLENGYGISLRALMTFAAKTYNDGEVFTPKVLEDDCININDQKLIAKIRKAIAVIQLKCEGQVIARHPEYNMDERLLLSAINQEEGTVCIGGVCYPLKDKDFPTIDPENPYALSEEEQSVMNKLRTSFRRSSKLQAHIRFLYDVGSLYKIYNSNLMFHACVPLNKDGSFQRFEFDGMRLWGKKLFDYCESQVRKAYFAPENSREKQNAVDFMYWLWCGKDSPLLGKLRMTTFERMLIGDKQTWEEPKNFYYKYNDDQEIVCAIMEEFGVNPSEGHIINGHMPVKLKDGESPIKAGGKLMVIDGGFCKAYQTTTGIAGYTLIYNSYGLRLAAHEPFDSITKAVEQNSDIYSTSNVFELASKRMLVADTDVGTQLKEQIEVLSLLLQYYMENDKG